MLDKSTSVDTFIDVDTREVSDVEPVRADEGVGAQLLRAPRPDLRRRLPARGAARACAAAAAVAGGADLMAAVETPVACCAPLGAPALDEAEALATAELFKALGDP